MKYLLIYFTGTFNTRFLTDKLEQALVSRGDTVDRVEINCETQVVSTDGYDFIGFSYPIYGFNSPRAFNQYVAKLKFNKGQKYFIYKNSGENLAMNNASSRILLRRMKRKKLDFCGEYHFVMPYNIHFPFETNCVRQVLDQNKKLLKVMLYNLDNGIVHKIKSKWIYNFAAVFVSIVKIAGDINSFFYKVDMDKCVKCMRCVKDCPEKNIRFVNGKFKFSHHCEMCMRCSFYCPTDAFKIGFLKGWKVNGDYKLNQLEKDQTPYEPFVTDKTEGFFQTHYKHFKAIDEEYEKIFGIESQVEEVSNI